MAITIAIIVVILYHSLVTFLDIAWTSSKDSVIALVTSFLIGSSFFALYCSKLIIGSTFFIS